MISAVGALTVGAKAVSIAGVAKVTETAFDYVLDHTVGPPRVEDPPQPVPVAPGEQPAPPRRRGRVEIAGNIACDWVPVAVFVGLQATPLAVVANGVLIGSYIVAGTRGVTESVRKHL